MDKQLLHDSNTFQECVRTNILRGEKRKQVMKSLQGMAEKGLGMFFNS